MQLSGKPQDWSFVAVANPAGLHVLCIAFTFQFNFELPCHQIATRHAKFINSEAARIDLYSLFETLDCIDLPASFVIS